MCATDVMTGASRPRAPLGHGRRRTVALVGVAFAALVACAGFAFAANVSNHTVLSNGIPEHRGVLDSPVWIPPPDLSWDSPPPSPTLDSRSPYNRPAAVDPLLEPGQSAPPAPSTPGPSTPTTAPATTTQVPLEPGTSAALVMLNEARSSAGCSPLDIDPRLTAAARGRAEGLADGTGGVDPARRMLEAGYPSPGAENVAHGQASLTEATAELLVSSSHRASVVDCSVVRVGLAHALGPRGDYWVQDFGR